MATHIKKRALAEYTTQVVQQEAQEVPEKKIRLVKKTPTGATSAAVFIGRLDKCSSSNNALQLLLRAAEYLHFDEEDLQPSIKKLMDYYRAEKESAVRVVILALLADIGCNFYSDSNSLLELTREVLALTSNEESHKVRAQTLGTLLRLAKCVNNPDLNLKLIDVAKVYLKDTSHSVKSKCLFLIGELLPLGDTSVSTTLHLINCYTHSQDARVRGAAYKTLIGLHERGLSLDFSMYRDICKSLNDDYEIVRQSALKLVWILAQQYPENKIPLNNEGEEIRLVDDAFGLISNGVNDLSMQVRTQSAQLLGTMTLVSPEFLSQTLDKKLMSNMRKKSTAHEMAWKNVTSGEWSSGKKWMDDAPQEKIEADQINLMSSGACGAFVHGLEDEFLEVRQATVDAICSLSLNNSDFAVLCLDFLVDMFNDEIEEVRLRAIDSLSQISSHITLREDQLETILGGLEDFSLDVRDGLRRILASCRLSTKNCLQMCVSSLLDNLKKYPQDKKSLYHCLQKMGSSHPSLTLPLVHTLLAIHPFFDTAEKSVDEPAYISVLILIFNAAQHCSTMLPLFEEKTIRHYSYLRDTMPHLVPHLNLLGSAASTEMQSVPTSTCEFLRSMLQGIEEAPNTRVRVYLLQCAEEDLSRLSKIDSKVSGCAQLITMYINSLLLLHKIIQYKLWYSVSSPSSIRQNIVQLLQNTLKLEYLFVGLSDADLALIKQFKVKVLALQLVYVVRATNQSARTFCQHFLLQVELMSRFLKDKSIQPEEFIATMMRDLNQLEDTKPGTVARCLLPLLQLCHLTSPPQPNTQVGMCYAVINAPALSSDTVLKFTAGLLMGINLDADIYHLSNTQCLRIKVKYPDQQTHLIIPQASHLKLQNYDDGNTHRLVTTALVSAQVWTESSHVEISLVLDLSQNEGPLSHSLQTSIQPCIVDLCKPVKINIQPKPVKRGI
uniref:Integrator complex subunit 4 n=1 Tax=Cacopsylla melanoneura TaxID=428564 RepID=A0A8D9FEG4_9HEMI